MVSYTNRRDGWMILLFVQKAVYTRLYVEFLHHKQRMEDEKKACLQQFQEKLEREKPAYTKVRDAENSSSSLRGGLDGYILTLLNI